MTTPSPAPATAPKAAPTPIRQNRMTLDAITTGRKLNQPERIVLYGLDGVGKSTFGAHAPKPIFLGAEDGTGYLDVARFPLAESWEDVVDAIRTLADNETPYKTLVVDTVDWVEPLIWRHICIREKATSIEEVGGGYGRGHEAARELWRIFLSGLEKLQRVRSMGVILLAHCQQKTFKNPEGPDFDRYSLKLNDKAAALLREWSDHVLFATFETLTTEQKKRVRGVSTGARLMHTVRTAAFDAKHRGEMPDVLPFSWDEFEAAVKAQKSADPVALVAEIERKAKELGGKLEEETLKAIGRAAGDASKLSQLNIWLNGKLAEKAEKENSNAG
jgi:hypothetical protein